LKKRYWGQHLWATGYGTWCSDNITDDIVQQYFEHHRKGSDKDGDSFILE